MEQITQLDVQLMTGEIQHELPAKYQGLVGAKVRTPDGTGNIKDVEPYADQDVLVTLLDGYSFWYNLNNIKII